jgi:hypothetical protein
MYKIQGADQKEYGPASVEQVRQWIAEGRLAANSQVQAEGSGEWKPLAGFPEFAAALAAKTVTGSTSGGPSLTPPPLSSSGGRATGLAVTSLVLGVLSVAGCTILTGIPAIITGHIAHNKSRRAPQQFAGGGLAIAGFVLGYLSLIIVPFMLALFLPALAKAKDRAQTISCVNQMKQVGLAARMWSNDNGGKFPPDFASMSNELVNPKILVCPGDSSKTVAASWSTFSPGNVSYDYLEPGLDENAARPQTVVFQCPIHGNVGMADGSVVQGGQRKRTKRL